MKDLFPTKLKLGILAGGQLGKMLVSVANDWGIETYVMDKDNHCPAANSCSKFIQGDPFNFDDLMALGEKVDIITVEIENVNIPALKLLKEKGKTVHPSPEVLEIIQDKGQQKKFFNKHHISTSNFEFFDSVKSIINAVEQQKLKIPFVQKLRKGGYDGRGVVVVKTQKGLKELLEGRSIVEDYIELKKEVSIITARNANGEIKSFPLVDMEMNYQVHLVEKLLCPSVTSDKIQQKAKQIAEDLIKAFDMCGILAIEMFISANGELLVNEVSPRPHNTGHHTIESNKTSQYQQHLRAIFNLALGSTEIISPSVMINFLGEPNHQGPVIYEGLKEVLKIEGVYPHIYGKKETKPWRKMGHATILSTDLTIASQKADQIKQLVKVRTE